MKKFILLLLLISINVNSQIHLLYKCKNLPQRDSISNDLKNKGYKEYVCDSDGFYLNLQEDTFCYNTSLMGYTELTLKEFYSNVKIVEDKTEPVTETEPTIETTQEVKSIDSYLTETDVFNGKKTYRGGTGAIQFVKVKSKKGTTQQYVSLTANGSTLNVGRYGVSILFQNGQKIIRSKEKVDTDSDSEGWNYSAFFTPTPNEIKLLKTQKATLIRLYIYDENISDFDSNIILNDAKVILTTPKK